MASTWQKMMFFLGLVDEENAPEPETERQVTQSQVRTVERQDPAGTRLPTRRAAAPAPSRTGGPDAVGAMPPERSGVVAGRRVVPELIQGEFTADRVARVLGGWLDDPAEAIAGDW